MRFRLLRRPRRALLRTRVLVGVLLVTLAVLAAFDVAGVTALRTYLTGQTDTQLQSVLRLYRFISVTGLAARPSGANFNSRPRQRRTNAGQHFTTPNTKVPPPAVIQAPFLQPYSLITVSGKIVKGVSPTISLGGGVVIHTQRGVGYTLRLPREAAMDRQR